jgi:hypothetical protein
MMSVRSSENQRLHFVESRIDVGSIHLVGASDVTGVDRSEHAINCEQVLLVDREYIADEGAVSGLA